MSQKNLICLLVCLLISTVSVCQPPVAPPPQPSTGPICPASGATSEQPPSCIGQLTNIQYATSKVTPDQRLLIKDSPTTKNSVAFAAKLAGQRGQVSLTLKGAPYVRHPSGSTLFPQNGGLASDFDNVISTIQNAGKTVNTVQQQVGGQNVPQSIELTYFVPIFRKLQFMILNDLYNYLTSIYSTFSMTYTTTTTGGAPTASLADAAIGETQNALNKKSLIVDHLLNVIQGQMFFICAHHQPLIPKNLGLKTGSLMLQHDVTVDPIFLIQDMSQPFFPGDLTTDDQKNTHAAIQGVQSTYLNALKTVINFFTTYTNYLTQPDPTSKIPGSNGFVPLAKQVAKVMDNDAFAKGVKKILQSKSTDPVKRFLNLTTPPLPTNPVAQILGTSNDPLASATTKLPGTTSRITQLRQLKSTVKAINPPLFSYNSETLRALKVIPQAASELPAGVQSVAWPAQLVKAATSATPAKTASGDLLGYLVAYFTTSDGTVTQDQSQAAHLYINLPTANGPYAQEIIKQPDWLNNKAGIISILRGCLGDYSQLVGKGILEPCTEAIVCKALGITCPASQGINLTTCQQQLTAINQTQQQYIANAASANQAPSPTPPSPAPPAITPPGPTPPSQPTNGGMGQYLPPTPAPTTGSQTTGGQT